jgi:hypothetical protein
MLIGEGNMSDSILSSKTLGSLTLFPVPMHTNKMVQQNENTNTLLRLVLIF